jgi:hypothetical protein
MQLSVLKINEYTYTDKSAVIQCNQLYSVKEWQIMKKNT